MPAEAPVVYMLCGLTGSGKTTYARSLEAKGLQRLSIDEAVFERHGRYDVDYPHGEYQAHHAAARAELDERLLELLRRRESVVLDYGFWSRAERNRYKRLIEEAGGSWKLVYFKVDRDVLERRLGARNERADANALTVDGAMLDDFLARFEAPVNECSEIVNQTSGGRT
jgi:predicted kinase